MFIASGALPHLWQRLSRRVPGDSGTQWSWKVHCPGHSLPSQDQREDCWRGGSSAHSAKGHAFASSTPQIARASLDPACVIALLA